MATALLPHAIAPATYAEAAPAAWWRRAHSYSLPTVIAVEVAGSWLVVRLAEAGNWSSPNGEIVTAGMIGVIFAQSFLLGLWAALGGLPTVPRWLVVGLVYVVGATILTQPFFAGNWQSFWEMAPEFFLLGGILMTIFAALLLPLRRLAAWRIDFDRAYYPSEGGRRGQLSMMDFAAMFCAAALPLTLGRVLIDTTQDDGVGILAVMGIFALLVLATAAPVAYAVLAHRRLAMWLVLAAGWVVALSWGQSLLAMVWRDLNIFDSPVGMAGMHWTTLAFHVAIASTIAVPLLALRCCGLKLLTVDSR